MNKPFANIQEISIVSIETTYKIVDMSVSSFSIKFYAKFQAFSRMPGKFQSNRICLVFTVIIV